MFYLFIFFFASAIRVCIINRRRKKNSFRIIAPSSRYEVCLNSYQRYYLVDKHIPVIVKIRNQLFIARYYASKKRPPCFVRLHLTIACLSCFATNAYKILQNTPEKIIYLRNPSGLQGHARGYCALLSVAFHW